MSSKRLNMLVFDAQMSCSLFPLPPFSPSFFIDINIVLKPKDYFFLSQGHFVCPGF